MLYVFQVDTGIMLTFDMTLAMESVRRLQEKIAQTCQIAEDKQVLLISGGQSLSPTARVCSYSAGTDTNPIFLFSKNTIESATPPTGSINFGTEGHLSEQVEGSMSMQPSYETVVTRTQLALQFQDSAKEEMRLCESLVHDQHLQHQGWAAVIANLEDITSAFRTKWQSMSEKIEQHLSQRQQHIEILNSFPDTVSLLSKIPILGCLSPSVISMTTSHASQHSGSQSPPGTPPPSPGVEPHRPATLLEWISAQESRATLDQMAQQCLDGLNQFDEKVREGLRDEVSALLVAVDNPSMKEVKGLEDRLYGLEQLMYGARKLVQEQGDMAQGFLQNQTRARNLQDLSVLPDLCTSHKRQLVAMLKNHGSLQDIRRRCVRAKDELSENLHTRLRWVMYVEKTICDLHSKLVIYLQRLRKLQHALRLVLQMHSAPAVYCSAVIEVIRRKHFSDGFFQWSSGLCDKSKHLHESELKKRNFFASFFKNHFLQALFPGFSDKPPAFATKCPDMIDEKLPPIKHEDITFLREKVPELSDKLTMPADSDSLLVFPQVTFSDPPTSSSNQSAGREPGDSSVIGSDRRVAVSGSDSCVPVERDKDSSTEDAVVLDTVDDTVVIDTAAAVQATMDSLASPRVTLAGSVTVSQSVEVVTETEVSSLQQAVMAPRPVTARHKASLSSPDTDTEGASEGFTTADFYIDESMPSSLTESAGRKLAELTQQLQERTGQVEARDREIEGKSRELEAKDRELEIKLREMEAKDKELSDAHSRLARTTTSLRRLHDSATTAALQLRCDVLSLERAAGRGREDILGALEAGTARLVTMVAETSARAADRHRAQTDALTAAHEAETRALNDRLEVTGGLLRDAQAEVTGYDRKLTTATEEIDTLVATVTRLETLAATMATDHAAALTHARNQGLLEQEVELERLRSDLETDLGNRDVTIATLTATVADRDATIATLTGTVAENERTVTELRASLADTQQTLSGLRAELAETRTVTTVTTLTAAREEVTAALRAEHEAEQSSLRATLEAEKTTALAAQREQLTVAGDDVLARQRDELATTHAAAVNAIQRETEAETQRHGDEVERIHGQHEEEMAALRTQHDDALSRLQSQHEDQLSRLRCESATESQDSPTLQLSEEDFVTVSTHREEIQKVISEQQMKHSAEITELTQRLQDKHHSLQEMKTSVTAERQVLFNEALNKLVEDHKTELDQLQREEQRRREQLQGECDQLREQLGKTHDKAQAESSHEKSSQYPSLDGKSPRPAPSDPDLGPSQSNLDLELTAARQRISELEAQLCSPSPSQLALTGPCPQLGVSAMGQSVMAVYEGVDPRIQVLESTIKNKSEEVNRLQSKIMELSMSTSFRGLVQDKVSITTCNVSDLVLLCLDDQRANYVVFTVTNLLHFLHSDYLTALGLKTGPGEAKKSWVLAEVTEKEYCQAKKPQNRYNVPVGTKFYRIKARPWSRESVLQQQAQLRGAQGGPGPSVPGVPHPGPSVTGAPHPGPAPLGLATSHQQTGASDAGKDSPGKKDAKRS